MTQDQPGQARGTGHVVRDEAVPDDETEATQDEESGATEGSPAGKHAATADAAAGRNAVRER